MANYYSINGDTELTEEKKLQIENLPTSNIKQAFTTLCFYNGDFIFLSEHLKRLKENALSLNFELPDLQAESLNSELMLLKDKLALDIFNEKKKVRISIFETNRGINYSIYINYYNSSSASQIRAGLCLDSRKYSTENNNIKYIIPLQAQEQKNLQNLNHLIYFNEQNELLETEYANLIFIDTEERFIFPFSASSYIFQGITQKKVKSFLVQNNKAVISRKVHTNELPKFKEIWMTNSLIGIKPINSIYEVTKNYDTTIFKNLALKFLNEKGFK